MANRSTAPRLPVRTLHLATIVLLSAAVGWFGPGAADSSPHVAGSPLDYYLVNSTAGRLELSEIPPSARNDTELVVRVASEGSPATRVLGLSLPGDDFVINEDGRLSGHLRIRAALVNGTLGNVSVEPARASAEVHLVEGARSSLVVSYGGYCDPPAAGCDPRPWDAKTFSTAFPAHEPAVPHSHGNGSDPNRGLHARDVYIQFTFRVQPGQGTTPALPAVFDFSVLVDGSAFFHVHSLGPVPAWRPPGGPSPSASPTSFASGGTPTTSPPPTTSASQLDDEDSDASGSSKSSSDGPAVTVLPVAVPANQGGITILPPTMSMAFWFIAALVGFEIIAWSRTRRRDER